MTDMVNNPAHYTGHPVFTGECYDYAKALENGAEFSVFRYAWRWRNKFNPTEDLNKAGWYLDRLLKDYPRGREQVNRTRTGLADKLENSLCEWCTEDGERDMVDDWAALVNIHIMRGAYHKAKYHLNNLIHEVTRRTEGTETLDPIDYPAAIPEATLAAVSSEGEPRHVLTSFTYAANVASMVFNVDPTGTGQRTVTVTVYAELPHRSLDDYVSLVDTLAGCEDLVIALVDEGASMFTYSVDQGRVKWSLKVDNVADNIRSEVRHLGDLVELHDVVQLRLEVHGLEVK